MIYQIKHITHYRYNENVNQCYNVACSTPRKTEHQQCLRSQINIRPFPAYSQKRSDYFGNPLQHFAIQLPHKELTITVSSRVEIQASRYSAALPAGNACQWVQEKLKSDRSPATLTALEYLFDSPMIKSNDQLAELGRDLFTPDRPLLQAAAALTERIFTDYTYDPHFTTVTTPLSEVMEHKRGVCQDFAHLAIGCLRSLGFPARYVSGYLETLPPPGKEKLEGADATHAWLAVYSPGEGWVEFDPTNNTTAAERHITTAWGRDYSDVSPLKGVMFGGGKKQQLSVSVDVRRLE